MIPSSQFDGIVVSKPWGAESLLYYNEQVELWYLRLNKGQRTSLHCHPNKKTGLIILDGRARISFLSDEMEVGPLDIAILRPGLFHSTACLSDSLSMLEIETPPDKSDLVRLEDPYGRVDLPYETQEHYLPDLKAIKLSELYKNYQLNNCMLCVVRPGQCLISNDDVLVILAGSLTTNDVKKVVLGPGDIIVGLTFHRLAKYFTNNDLIALRVTRLAASLNRAVLVDGNN